MDELTVDKQAVASRCGCCWETECGGRVLTDVVASWSVEQERRSQKGRRKSRCRVKATEEVWKSYVMKEEGEKVKLEEDGAEGCFDSLLGLEQTPVPAAREDAYGKGTPSWVSETPGAGTAILLSGLHSSCILPEVMTEWCHGHGQCPLGLGN